VVERRLLIETVAEAEVTRAESSQRQRVVAFGDVRQRPAQLGVDRARVNQQHAVHARLEVIAPIDPVGLRSAVDPQDGRLGFQNQGLFSAASRPAGRHDDRRRADDPDAPPLRSLSEHGSFLGSGASRRV
jgi:hypothetical protein